MKMIYRSDVKLPNDYKKRLVYGNFEVYEFYSEQLKKYYYIFKCIGPHLYIVFDYDELDERKVEAKNMDRIICNGCYFDFNPNDEEIIESKQCYLTDDDIKKAIDNNIEIYKRKDVIDYMKGKSSQIDLELEPEYQFYLSKEEATMDELIDFLTFMKKYNDKFSQGYLVQIMLKLIKNYDTKIHGLANIFCEQIFSDSVYPIKIDFTVIDEMIKQIKNTKSL